MSPLSVPIGKEPVARASIGGSAGGIPQERRYARQPRENHGVRRNGWVGGMREPVEPAEIDPVNGTVLKGGNETVSEGRWAKVAARAIADRALTATYVRVLAALAIFADREGVAWPSQETIALLIGISRSTVCRAIKRLRDLGYLD